MCRKSVSRTVIEEIAEFVGNLVGVVDEPDYSESVLAEMEEKYGIKSEDFYTAYKSGNLVYNGFVQNDIDKWIHHIEVLKLLKRNK